MQEQALEEAAKNIRTHPARTAEETAEYDNVRSRADHLKSLYDRVFSRILDASATPSESFFSRIVEGPVALTTPVWPRRTRLVLLGMLVGAASGFGLVILLFVRRIRLFSVPRIEHLLNLRPLAHIPLSESEEQVAAGFCPLNKLPKHDPMCEAYRSLRTAVEGQLGQSDRGRILIISSAEQGEGKTFTTINVATVFAWQYPKVLLIDADLRKPSLTRRAIGDPAKTRGFLQYLQGETDDWKSLALRNEESKLDILPAGPASSHAAELLQSERVARMFEEMRREYEFIIIDTAPINAVVDTILLSKYADGLALVMVPGKTRIPSLQYALSRIPSTRVLGYVANRLTSSSRTYYSYYGRDSYYGRGQYYGSLYGYGYYGKRGYYGKPSKTDGDQSES